MKKHLTFKDDKSDKFWNIEVSGKSFTVTYGKAGTDGASQTKTFKSGYECLNEAEKLVSEKVKKGYEEMKGNADLTDLKKDNSFEAAITPFFGQLCLIKSEPAYVFNWRKIGTENKESFMECYEGCEFVDRIEEKTLLPLAIIDGIIGADDVTKKKYSINDVLEIVGRGELASVLLLEKTSGKIYISDEGGEVSLFCDSPDQLKIELKQIPKKDKACAKSIVIEETKFPQDYIDRIKKAAEKKAWFNFGSQKLTSLPEEAWTLIHLEEFDAYDNQLSSLPAGIGRLMNLKKINIRVNKLTSISSDIGLLDKLEELNMDTNELQTLPPEIGKLKKLKHLDLKKNKFKTLPPEISGLTGLKVLSLNKNKTLKDLPASMSEMVGLESLWLENTALEKVPDVLLSMKNLKYLYMTGTKIPDSELAQLKKILHKTRVDF